MVKDKERRSAERAKRVMSVAYRKVDGKKRNKWELSATEDISSAGASFLTDQEFRPGDVIEVQIRMSGMLEMFSGLTEVVRVVKKESGSHFFIAVKRLISKKSTKK